jgi:hypothetical protein
MSEVAGEVIRKFADAEIQKSIDRVLQGLEEDRMGAVVAYGGRNGASLAVMAKIGGNWSVVGVLNKPWKGELEYEAAVRFAW